MNRNFTALTGSFDEVQRRDLFIKNNPVLIQGLGLSPVIMAAVTLENAVILAIAMFLIGFVARIVCGGIHRTNEFFLLRPAVYAVVASALYIPALILLVRLFGGNIKDVGMYLPLIVVDQMILSSGDNLVYQRLGERITSGFLLYAGFGAVIIAVGAVREFFGVGELYGVRLVNIELLPVMNTPAGGFILVALFAAMLQAAIHSYKRIMTRRTRFDDDRVN